jgi:hypothetical protein
MILVGYRHECAPPGVNRVSYDALADPLAWAACAPGKKRSPAPRLVLVNPSAQCVGLPGGDANHSVCFRDRAWLRTVCECVKLHTHSNTDELSIVGDTLSSVHDGCSAHAAISLRSPGRTPSTHMVLPPPLPFPLPPRLPPTKPGPYRPRERGARPSGARASRRARRSRRALARAVRPPPSHTPRDSRLPQRRSQEARKRRQSEVRAERNRGAGGVVIPRGVGTVG